MNSSASIGMRMMRKTGSIGGARRRLVASGGWDQKIGVEWWYCSMVVSWSRLFEGLNVNLKLKDEGDL